MSMHQVLQDLQSGATKACEIPIPVIAEPGEVLIANEASLLAAGTEKSIVDFARKSIWGKARGHPDQVRRVLQKIKKEGFFETLRQVRSKLSEPMALGYSAAGTVLEVGREVREFRPGDRVVSNGSHAGVTASPQNLVARLPKGVSFADGCYGVLGAIALQGVRLSRAGLSDRVVVVGLGLIGQITVMLLNAAGCEVFGTDPDASRRKMAEDAGAKSGTEAEILAIVQGRTNGQGADAVVITASTTSNAPLEFAAVAARKKGIVVAVGAVRLDVPRREFYPKELELVVSCSYGPGRYDANYEERGNDYPYAYVRWTEQRNIEGFLELIDRKQVDVKRLTTHTFPIEDAEQAYALLNGGAGNYLGIVLSYPPATEGWASGRTVTLNHQQTSARTESKALAISFIGAGNFASLVLIPRVKQISKLRLRAICSASGTRAVAAGKRHGFEQAGSDADDILADTHTDAVFVATPHFQHSEQVLKALRAGKHVFVEKPLAISSKQLDEFLSGLEALVQPVPVWTVGFNRRFSAPTRALSDFFADISVPLTMLYRFNAGPLPAEHWTHDPAIGGGRLVGEACHAIDLSRHLMRSPIVSVFAAAIPPGSSASNEEDQALITLTHESGAIATIGYFAGGDKAFPKERVELFGGGRVAVIDDFGRVSLCKGGRIRERKFKPGSKGHDEEVEAFIKAARTNGPPPIAYDEIINVSRATLAVVESLRIGLPVRIAP